MKDKIHPKVNKKAKVTCNCGHTFTTTSVLEEIRVEVCSQCHPFYTGVEKFIDTEGRVDSFKRKQDVAKERQKVILQKLKVKKTKEKEQKQGPLSLKDLLKQASK